MRRNKFGEMARQARYAKMLKAPEAAEAVGVSRNHLYEIEAGTRAPSLDLVSRIAEALEINISSATRAYAGDRAASAGASPLKALWLSIAEGMPAQTAPADGVEAPADDEAA